MAVKTPITTMPVKPPVSLKATKKGGVNTMPAGHVIKGKTGNILGVVNTVAPGEPPIKPTISSNGQPFEVNRRTFGHSLANTESDASTGGTVAITGTATTSGGIPVGWLIVGALGIWFVFFRKGGVKVPAL
jgi:hypothetical protein